MFDDFRVTEVPLEGGVVLHVRSAGSGPPVLLLHGYPQCGAAWHAVAPRLRDRFTVIVPDLPGYGDSIGRPVDAANANHSKRQMATDLVALMAALGHERFGVAGHDRGGRVGYRMALDHPARVSAYAAVDLIPTLEVWNVMNADTALSTFHWLLLAQPAPLPERLIGPDPDGFLEHLLTSWAGRRAALDAAAVAEYQRHHREPRVRAAMFADYRAGATVDREHDRADVDAGRRIACPTLVLWGRRYLSKRAASPADVWRRWATDVSEVAIDCGHFLAEEEPERTAAALATFFRG